MGFSVFHKLKCFDAETGKELSAERTEKFSALLDQKLEHWQAEETWENIIDYIDRPYYDDMLPALLAASKETPDVRILLLCDFSSTGEMPGYSWDWVQAGKHHDATPRFRPLPFKPEKLVEPEATEAGGPDA